MYVYICVCMYIYMYLYIHTHTHIHFIYAYQGFPGDSDGKESACDVGDLGLIPGLGRSPGEENGNPLWYSCLENLWTENPGGLQTMGLQSWTKLKGLHFLSFTFIVT